MPQMSDTMTSGTTSSFNDAMKILLEYPAALELMADRDAPWIVVRKNRSVGLHRALQRRELGGQRLGVYCGGDVRDFARIRGVAIHE